MSTLIKGKMVKRKKEKVDFTAENIDNMAPVNKILDDLQYKNNQAYTFYCQTLRQRKSVKDNNYHFHYTVSGHPLNAFPSDWDGDLNSGYFEAFPYKSLMPRFMTQICNVDKKDPVTEWMKLKKDWIRDCHKYRLAAEMYVKSFDKRQHVETWAMSLFNILNKLHYWSESTMLNQVSANMMKKYESLNDEVMECPMHFVEMAAHLDSDPDTFFNSTYNWYYAGNGNLQLICVVGVDFLLHSVFSTLYLTQFFKSEMILNIEHETTFDCEGNNILETIFSSQNIIALRTQKKIYILKIDTLGDKIVFEKIKSMESELPFTSISFDNFHKNILYITGLENKLTIVNLDRLRGRTVKLKNKIDSLTDNWSTVISSHRACYIHATKASITTYDKRTNTPILTWNRVRDITDDLSCNEITSAKQMEDSKYLYIGTDHHLFLMDLRFHKKSKSHKAAQRWTHGMQCVPTYMSTCNFEYNKELICLSSQWCEDTCLVINYAENVRVPEIQGVTMPYHPPSILSTLNEARQNLLCFDLYNPIDSRLCTSITGSIIVENGEDYNILMLNALGDISYHTLYPEHMEPFVNEDSPKLLHEWSKSFERETRNFEVSSIENLNSVWKKLCVVPSSHIIGQGKLMTDASTKFNENKVFNVFEKEDIDCGLVDVWLHNSNNTHTDEKRITQEQSSQAFNLYYTDDSN